MKKQGVILVIPHQPETANILSGPSGITQPLGMGYVASYLEREGFKVSILDNSIEGLNNEQFVAYVKDKNPLCVGFTVCTSSYNNALSLARLVKEVGNNIFVIMGGVQPSALPVHTLRNAQVDIVVKGEGEETFLELARAIGEGSDFGTIKGIVYKKGNAIVENPDRLLIADINALPLPAYHLMPMDKYTLPASRKMTPEKSASIITSRGCPYGCLFCSHNSIFKGKVRFRSPENVVSEIKHLVKEYHVGELLIWDDSFLLDKKRALEICRLMKKDRLNLIWSCSSRVDQISDELAEALYSTGCRLILFGAESGSQAILDTIGKRTTLEQIRNAVTICRRHKIMSFCSFILGTPAETEETAKETLAFAKKLDPDFAIFCIFAPLPGSLFFDRFISEGKLDIEKIDWDRYINLMSSAPPLMSASSLSDKRLVEIQKKCFREFYFRPYYILRKLKNIRSKEQAYQNMRGAKALLNLALHKFHFRANEG